MILYLMTQIRKGSANINFDATLKNYYKIVKQYLTNDLKYFVIIQ